VEIETIEQRFEFNPNSFIHLSKPEKGLWLTWMREHYGEYTGMQYDIHVGDGLPVDDAWPENVKAMSQAITRHRIDAMCWKEKTLWIMEIKPYAGVGGIGQLLSYRELYVKDTGYASPIQLGLITDFLTPDMSWLCKRFSITPFTVVPANI
jgi:hypothetical protein